MAIVAPQPAGIPGVPRHSLDSMFDMMSWRGSEVSRPPPPPASSELPARPQLASRWVTEAMQAFSNEEVPRIHLPRPTDPATTRAEDAARRGVRIVIPGDDSAMPPPPPTSPSPSSSPRKKKKVNKRTVKAGTVGRRIGRAFKPVRS